MSAARGVYVLGATAGSGKSLVTLGLVDLLHGHADALAFFRPITATPAGVDPDDDPMVRLVRDRFGVGAARGALSREQARALLAEGRREEVYRRCVEVWAELAAQADVVVVDGTDVEDGRDLGVELDLNTELANHVGAAVVAVVGGATPRGPHAGGDDEAVAGVVESVDLARRSVLEAGCSLAAVLANRVPAGLVEAARGAVHRGASRRPVYVLPETPELAWPSVAEIAQDTGAQVRSGEERLVDRDVRGVRVAAMAVEHFLDLLGDSTLVLTPGDRADVLVATVASASSPGCPVPAAVLLTGGLAPHPRIAGMLAGAPFPVLAVDDDTFSAARAVDAVRADLGRAGARTVATALGVFAAATDAQELVERLAVPRPARMTPVRFAHELVLRAAAQRRRVVLPEGTEPRIQQAAEILVARGVCDLVLLGEPGAVAEVAAAHGTDLSGVEVVDPATSEHRERFAQEYARVRASRGVDLATARDAVQDVSLFGTSMVHLGLVDGMVSGAAHTTAHTIRPALQVIGTTAGVDTVSSVFLMCLPDRVLAYGDCAVVPDPTAEQLADIAVASAATAARFGIEPRVAMLSYSTGRSGSGPSVDKVRRATDLVRSRRPDLTVEGPIQYDAAVDASVAASKLPGSAVAGQATVFVFPDLDTGNTTYKAVQQSSGAVAIGPVLQGLAKPVNDLSRGATVTDVITTVAITAVQAQAVDDG